MELLTTFALFCLHSDTSDIINKAQTVLRSEQFSAEAHQALRKRQSCREPRSEFGNQEIVTCLNAVGLLRSSVNSAMIENSQRRLVIGLAIDLMARWCHLSIGVTGVRRWAQSLQ
jgi:hypothetical protein